MTSTTLQPARAKVRADAQGLHVFDRSSGLNVLIDEVVLPSSAWSQAPRYVSIALTNACELRCPFCYAPKTPARLDARQVGGWIEELDRGGCLGVGFGGGEPTAHPAIAEICAEAAEKTGMAVTLTTHGHRFSDGLARQLRGRVNFIRVSVDAVGVAYERIRGRSFAALCERLAVIGSVSRFGINMVVGDETVGGLDALAAFSAEVGAAELLLIPQRGTAAAAELSAEGSLGLGRWVRSYRGPVRLAISRAGTPAGIPLADPFAPEEALNAHAHVDAQGHLRPDAYSAASARIGTSIMAALESLRGRS